MIKKFMIKLTTVREFVEWITMNKSQRDINLTETDQIGIGWKKPALRHFYFYFSTFHKLHISFVFFLSPDLTRRCKVCEPYLMHARDRDFANSHMLCVQSRLINDSFDINNEHEAFDWNDDKKRYLSFTYKKRKQNG